MAKNRKDQLENLKVNPNLNDANNWFIYMSKRQMLKECLTEEEKESCDKDAWGLPHLEHAIKRVDGARRMEIQEIITSNRLSPKEKLEQLLEEATRWAEATETIVKDEIAGTNQRVAEPIMQRFMSEEREEQYLFQVEGGIWDFKPTVSFEDREKALDAIENRERIPKSEILRMVGESSWGYRAEPRRPHEELFVTGERHHDERSGRRDADGKTTAGSLNG